MKSRFYILLFCLLMRAMMIAAQEKVPSWCPLEETAILSTEEPVVKTYQEGAQFWFQAEGGQSITIDRVAAFQISPDNKWIAFARWVDLYQTELRTIRTDGTDEKLLITAEEFTAMRTDAEGQIITALGNFDWIPFTQVLIFNTALKNTGDGLFIFVADDLWSVDTESGTVSNLLPQGQGGDFSFSPDGQHIAIMYPHSLSLIQSDGTHFREDVLESYAGIGFGEYYEFPPLYWNPGSDSLLVAVSSSTDPYSQHEGTVTLWFIPVDGTLPTEISTFRAFFLSFQLSPDLQFAAFWRTNKPQSNEREIVIARVDDSEEFIYREGRLLDFRGWTKNSGHFLYSDETSAERGPFIPGDICGG